MACWLAGLAYTHYAGRGNEIELPGLPPLDRCELSLQTVDRRIRIEDSLLRHGKGNEGELLNESY